MIAKPFGWVLCFLAVFAAGGARALPPPPPCLSMHDGWVRLSPAAAMPMAAGYGQLHNRCDRPQVVTAVASALFAEVSLHETTLVEGVSRMRPVSRLEVPANGSVVLAPAGLHLMLMHGTAALKDAQAVPLELQLEGGARVPLQLQVRQP